MHNLRKEVVMVVVVDCWTPAEKMVVLLVTRMRKAGTVHFIHTSFSQFVRQRRYLALSMRPPKNTLSSDKEHTSEEYISD